MTRIAIGIAFVFISALTTPASAITAREVMEKMTEKERYGYLTGLIDMLAYQAGVAGNGARMQCVTDAYYRDKSPKSDAWSRLFTAFGQFPDKQPATLMILLADKTCGK